jgi:hypothetical protein
MLNDSKLLWKWFCACNSDSRLEILILHVIVFYLTRMSRFIESSGYNTIYTLLDVDVDESQ